MSEPQRAEGPTVGQFAALDSRVQGLEVDLEQVGRIVGRGLAMLSLLLLVLLLLRARR